jgi:hypothetical protein
MFELPISHLQPSQLYISEEKLNRVYDWFNPSNKSNFDPVPIKLFDGKHMMTDGHTRTTAATLAGWDCVPVVWDDNPYDMLAYAQCVTWCKNEKIITPADLTKRIIPHRLYETLWNKRCQDMDIPPSYAAITARFGGLDGRHSVIILTDNTMEHTARLIQKESAAFTKSIEIINLDETSNYEKIYSLTPTDLLILHIGIESWTGKHKKTAIAFEKPKGLAAKYICVRPTITPKALLEGINTPWEVTENVIKQYADLPTDKPIRVKAEGGTDITLHALTPWQIPFETHKPGANAYLPPAEISYGIQPHTATGIIVADITVGELRVYADLINPFGMVDAPVSLHINNGEITEISGGDTARQLKEALWKLPVCCRKLVEFGIGLSRMTPCGIIGIDESIAGTCHFGFGNGSGNDAPVHLDVVAGRFYLTSIK